MELIRNAKLKRVTLYCDRDLEAAWLGYEFCIPSTMVNILSKFSENISKCTGDTERTLKH